MVVISVKSSASEVSDAGLDLKAWKSAHLMEEGGDLVDPDFPKETLGHYVRRNAIEYPDEDFMSDEFGHKLTFAQFSQMVTKISQYLQSQDVKRGQKVSVMSPNDVHALAVIVAASDLAVATVLFPPTFPYNQLRDKMELCQPRIHFCHGDIVAKDDAELLDAIPAATQKVVFTHDHITLPDEVADFEDVVGKMSGVAEDIELPPIQIFHEHFLIFFTSGTTGPAKAVITLQSAFIKVGLAYKYLREPLDNEFVFSNSIAWVGCISHFALCIVAQWRYRILNGYEKFKHFKEVADRNAFTTFNSGPGVVEDMLSLPQDLRTRLAKSLKLISCGGGFIPALTSVQLQRAFPTTAIMNVYAQTESATPYYSIDPSCFRVSDPPTEAELAILSTVGKHTPSVQPFILDEYGNVLKTGEVGELCVRTKGACFGYMNNVEATNKLFEHGYMHTGDLGFINEDGLFTMVGRTKDITQYNTKLGFKCYPYVIENNVIRGVPEVESCYWVGGKDAQGMACAGGFVVLAPGTTLSESEFRGRLRKILSGHEMPDVVKFMKAAEVPINVNGKVVRSSLRTLLEEHYGANTAQGVSGA